MVEEIKSISVIDNNSYYMLINKYGRNKVNYVLDKIIENEINNKKLDYDYSLLLWEKYGYYFAVNNNSIYTRHFVGDILKKDDYTTNDKGYFVMSYEGEKFYGLELLNRDYISIFLTDGDYVTLDINKIFNSIKSDYCKNYVIDRFNYLFRNCKRECYFDKDLKYLLKKYMECNNIYNDDSNIISEEELMDNIDMYVRYSIAYNRFMMCNDGLLRMSVGKYASNDMEFEDFYMNGVIRLDLVIKSFDVRKNYKFSTYAYASLSKDIYRSRFNESRVIKLPSALDDEKVKLNEGYISYINKYGRNPNIEELALFLNMDVDYVKYIVDIFKKIDCDSLDKYISDDDSILLSDAIIDKRVNVEKYCLSKVSFEKLFDIIKKCLNDKELDVIWSVFFEKESMQSIANRYHCSRENVRQIKEKALKKIRKYPYINEYKIY